MMMMMTMKIIYISLFSFRVSTSSRLLCAVFSPLCCAKKTIVVVSVSITNFALARTRFAIFWFSLFISLCLEISSTFDDSTAALSWTREKWIAGKWHRVAWYCRAQLAHTRKRERDFFRCAKERGAERRRRNVHRWIMRMKWKCKNALSSIFHADKLELLRM